MKDLNHLVFYIFKFLGNYYVILIKRIALKLYCYSLLYFIVIHLLLPALNVFNILYCIKYSIILSILNVTSQVQVHILTERNQSNKYALWSNLRYRNR